MNQLRSAPLVWDGCGPTENDGELLRRYAAGDQAAFTEVARRHTGLVLGVCRRALGHDADAEDATQATFELLAKKAASVKWRASVANWLHAAARRVARNARVAAERRRRHERRAAAPDAVSPLDSMTGRELLAAVDEELANLPAEYREALILCHLEGLGNRDAAARLGVTLGALRGRLQRGRARLAEALTRRGLAPSAGLAVCAGPAAADAARLAERAAGAAAGVGPSSARRLLAVVALPGVFAAVALPGGQSPAPKTPPAEPADVNVTGWVLRPDGKPAAGATLFAAALKKPGVQKDANVTLRRVGTAGTDGRFAVNVVPVGDRRFVYMVAHAPGFGVTFFQAEGKAVADRSRDITLRLVKDVPITGRVIDTEGKPVSGVRATVQSIRTPGGGSLDSVLKVWRAGNASQAFRTGELRFCPLDKVTGAAVTGKDGRFTLRGVGAERAVNVVLTGDDVARSTAYVLTRVGLDDGLYRRILARPENADVRRLDPFAGPFAPKFTFIIQRGRSVGGTVTNADGRPLTEVRVTAYTGPDDRARDVTDRRGRFRLDGLPRPAGGKYFIEFRPRAGSLYLPRVLRPAATPGVGTIRLDAKLSRGVVVSGRLIDEQTGRGVRGYVEAAPLRDNKYHGR